MASNTLPILTVLSLVYISGAGAGAIPTTATDFIEAKCRSTAYPAVCFQSLSLCASTIRRNPTQLARTALTVSLQKARSTRAFVAKLNTFRGLRPREYAALKDCLEMASDSVDRLSKSLRELGFMNRARGPERLWHISNAQTWVSASVTDDTTCMDGFAGRALDGRMKSSIKAGMTSVSQVTSNALVFINQLAGKY